MERGSLDKLKYDSRLARRRDWIDEADELAYLESLPDVSSKSIRGTDDAERGSSAAADEAGGESAAGTPEIPAPGSVAPATSEPWGSSRDEA